MIRIEHICIYGWEAAVRGMRNPMNSWDRSDSHFMHDSEDYFWIGSEDYKLMKNLIQAGTDHSKFMRYINVTMDIIAPEYWWKEYATYKVGTVENSTSTMHKIHAKEFTMENFSTDHMNADARNCLQDVIDVLNQNRDKFLHYNEFTDPNDRKDYWYQMIQLLPMSYNYRRTVQLNYQVLQNMYKSRKDHKLDEWRAFCEIIKNDFPYSEFITKDFKEAVE